MAGQPKAPFYIVLFAVIVGLVAFAAYRGRDVLFPKAPQPKAGDVNIDPDKLGGKPAAEAHDTGAVTTVKEYKFKPAERLPEVKGTAGFKPLKDNTVRFALNVWAGWSPIILANEGFAAKHVWKTADGEEFKVDLVLIDNPVTMRDAYASGDIHIGWGTLDMLPLFLEGFVDESGKPRDNRVMPRVFQQIDWSNGGDGIVVRENIKTVADLRGKKLVLAQNSPSHYFALNMLVSGGVQPSEVEFVFTEDAFQAAAAFNSQKDIAGCVSWSPDIYNLEKVKGNRMLVSTATANKLITDVWFARADFAEKNPGIIEAIVRGIFDAMIDLKDENKRKHVAQLMSEGYSIPATDTLAMLGDAHSTNWAENFQFFLNQNNPTNFERVWTQAYYLYSRIRSIKHRPVPFDQVMDFSVIQKLGRETKYSSQRDEYKTQLVPKTIKDVKAESNEILAHTIIIHFAPNDWDLHKKITRNLDGKSVEELYDPNVDFVLDEIGKLVGQFGAARIIIEGHTDASKRGEVPASVVKELSEHRANSVKQALVNKFNLNPNQLLVDGVGWDRPADSSDPDNHAKNRRVEVRVFSAEKD
jgi:NitT/TauT family transport system substrate-binding protein